MPPEDQEDWYIKGARLDGLLSRCYDLFNSNYDKFHSAPGQPPVYDARYILRYANLLI